MKMKSAGILPVIRGHVLLGRESFAKHWSGFGGRCDDSETMLQTALREFDEESCGIFDKEKTKQFVNNNLINRMVSTTPKGDLFHMYVIDVDDYVRNNPKYYTMNIQDTFTSLRNKETVECRKEKDYVKWIPWKHVFKYNCRRSFINDYRNVLPIIENYY